MAKVAPDQLFPGYTSDGTNITFALADLPELSATEADAATGNAGEVLRALMLATADAYAALAPEAQDEFWSVSRGNLSIAPGGQGYLRQQFNGRFDAQIVEVNLAESV